MDVVCADVDRGGVRCSVDATSSPRAFVRLVDVGTAVLFRRRPQSLVLDCGVAPRVCRVVQAVGAACHAPVVRPFVLVLHYLMQSS